jgi:carbonic anhydrase/acetyltransferase-like protein (isoleucine patch superfamily)
MLVPFDGHIPEAAAGCWLAETATLIGRVRIGRDSSIWYQAVLRGEYEDITIGAESNIQDGCVLHVDSGFPLTVGDRVSVGHRAVLHGCTIGDDVLIGMGAIVMNGATIGARSLVAAGAVVTEGMQIPAESLVAGIPAKVRRTLSADDVQVIRTNAGVYVDLARQQEPAFPRD